MSVDLPKLRDFAACYTAASCSQNPMYCWKFTGDFVQNTASIVWSASSAGLLYESGAEETSISVFAEVGHERNGVFFPQG